MEKQKKWQLFLILAVIALTIYNILPTLFYYAQPLSAPIDEKRAQKVVDQIKTRVEDLESDSREWLQSFCQLIRVTPPSIQAVDSNFILSFVKSDDAAKFRRLLPRAGSLISFVPAQLSLAPQEDNVKEVLVKKRTGGKLSSDLFTFAKKDSEAYRELIIDRASAIALALAGPSDPSYALMNLDAATLESLALQINSIADLPAHQKGVANRFLKSFTQGPFEDRPSVVQMLKSAFERYRDQMKGSPTFGGKEATLIRAEKFVKQHEALLGSGNTPWTLEKIKEQLEHKSSLNLGEQNPLFCELTIDWETSQIFLSLHPDVDAAALKQLLINEAAKITRLTSESLTQEGPLYVVQLHRLSDASGFLLLNLEQYAQTQASSIFKKIQSNWHPKHRDLKSLAVVTSEEFAKLPLDEKALSLVVHTPGEKNAQLFISVQGLDQIQKTYQNDQVQI